MTDIKKASSKRYRTRQKRMDYIDRESVFTFANFITLFFILCDFAILYSKWDIVQNESWYIVLLIAAGCAVVLDLPMMQAGKEVVRYNQGLLKSRSRMIFVVVSSVFAFLLVFGFSVWFGYETRTLFFRLADSSALTNNVGGAGSETVSDAATAAADAVKNRVILAAASFSNILPFGTSIASFVFTLITYDPKKERQKRIKKAKSWAEDNLSHVRQAIAEARRAGELEDLIACEKDAYKQFVGSVKAQDLCRKQAFRDALSERSQEDFDVISIIEFRESLREISVSDDPCSTEYAERIVPARTDTPPALPKPDADAESTDSDSE